MRTNNFWRFATIFFLSLMAIPVCGEIVEEMPKFPGGDQALMEFIENNLHCPKKMLRIGANGRVIVSFVVEKDGSITEPKVVKTTLKYKSGKPYENTRIIKQCEEEALRIVKMMPRWIPGKQCGVPVRVKYHIPVVFNQPKPKPRQDRWAAQQKKEFIPVDWEFIKKEATENPERIKELVARFSAKRIEKPLTDMEKILAFYGQSCLTNDSDTDPQVFEMYELRKAGKQEECLALTRKMLEINPLNLDALTTASNILFSLAKDSTSLNEANDYLLRSRFIFWTMLLTGDGSAEHPFYVTKISDEYNFMRHYLNIWKIKMQEYDGKCDIITLDGSSFRYDRPQIYFDVTRVREVNSSRQNKNSTPKKENPNSTSPPTKDSVLILINGEECRDITYDFINNGTYDDYEKFLNSRNLSLERIDIWKNEKKKDQFRRKFGNWVKDVVEITARPISESTKTR